MEWLKKTLITIVTAYIVGYTGVYAGLVIMSTYGYGEFDSYLNPILNWELAKWVGVGTIAVVLCSLHMFLPDKKVKNGIRS